MRNASDTLKWNITPNTSDTKADTRVTLQTLNFQTPMHRRCSLSPLPGEARRSLLDLGLSNDRKSLSHTPPSSTKPGGADRAPLPSFCHRAKNMSTNDHLESKLNKKQ